MARTGNIYHAEYGCCLGSPQGRAWGWSSMFCVHKDQLHEHRRTGFITHPKTLGQPCTLWSHPPDSSQSIPLVTSAFFLPWGKNTNKYVGLFLTFPFNLEVLKTSTRHLTLHGRLPTAAQNNTYFMWRRRRESVYSKINISTFIKHSTYSLFLPCLQWHSILIFILSTNTFFFSFPFLFPDFSADWSLTGLALGFVGEHLP